MAPKVAPYGTWDSPITSAVLVDNAAPVDSIFVDPVTSTVYHIENRPTEGGRNVIVKTEHGTDVAGKEFNCRTGVIEYGGAAATAYAGVVLFSNFSDNRVYSVKDGEASPTAVTPASDVLRYANFAVHPKYPYFVVAVQEDHTKPDPADVVTNLCVINTTNETVQILVSGADFYSTPVFTPDGSHIAWQQWKHPDMPWDGSEIYVASVTIDQGKLVLGDKQHVAGKWKEISAQYPVWASDDTLLFTSDVSGYQNPWAYNISSNTAAAVLEQPVPEDFSLPGWQLGWSYGAPLDKEGKLSLYTAMRGGRSVLYVVSLHSRTLEEIECPYVSIEHIHAVTDEAVVFLGAKADAPANPQSFSLSLSEKGQDMHVIFYPPTNPDYAAPDGEKPPCIVNVHGGPTHAATQAFDLQTQFFTSRGWAWLDVNYSGSSNYGREYMSRLNANWGVADVRDCALSVSILAQQQGLIDSQRAAIRGRSSGGFTVLATLCAYPDAFAAGASLFGISDLKKLDEFTHKFESRYCETLLGGTYKQVPDVYDGRSPVNNAEKIKSPLLVLQGSIDAVVPPEQAEIIVKTIQKNGGHVEYVVFEGEGHGWRKAENIKAALEKELAFYEGVFGLKKIA
ncbi:hypothetical protein PHLGIDRAFT_93514 [Phlebiopsis gigantea 11061_1 CR5-6]|uniref:Peptidase S9 prolyl oligopeptidase catalytic domain-containing protein n=1 Tax=Phlebiopsis gigantea (strain 11061_1 CR5-6) TaxID=745531 RepID=A0A0C3S711_PHLG1|nr:hypothetical protein PHLGIDRAFT_93514 [Phlebiopsis gigantea 11061_1 CR5-6]